MPRSSGPPSSGPCLVWDSPHGRVIHDLDRAVLILGREEVSDIVVLEPAVSRRHALIQVEPGTVTVTDLGSSGGTKINGARLSPDLPSTLAPGDMIQVGRVTLVFHEAEPPPVPLRLESEQAKPVIAKVRSKAPGTGVTGATGVKARKPIRRAPPASPAVHTATGSDTWKWVALGAAFLAVGVGGALVAVLMSRGDATPAALPEARIEEPAVEVEPPASDPDPLPEPPVAKPPKDPNRAPDGALPPQGFLSASEYPELLEVDGEQYYPVRLGEWNSAWVPVVGGDGRTYRIARGRVTKAENRIDLASRAARARAGLDPDDPDAHIALAVWCAERYIKRETRLLAARVLELRPGDAEAQRLLRLVE